MHDGGGLGGQHGTPGGLCGSRALAEFLQPELEPVSSESSISEPASIVAGTTWVVSGGTQDGAAVTKEQIEAAIGGEVAYSFEVGGN